MQLSRIPGWHVIIVADKKTPSDWNCPGCTMLTLEDQKNLGYKIYDYIPYNHYARKNIGYLYAISQGAEIIYDTDDDNIVLGNNLRYFPTEYYGPVIQPNNKFCNIYSYFSEHVIWPRGFPLDEIRNEFIAPKVFQEHRPLIQQGLVNGDPDVDAIFRLTRDLNINFSKQPELLSLPSQVMCPFNSQSTFFHQDAFWGLLIPVSTKFRVCDIWRGYVTQRLLWEIGGNLSFLAPQVVQERNEHNLLADFIDEWDLYINSKKLILALLKWKPISKKLEENFINLIDYLIIHSFYKPIELELAKAWIDDLKKINYKMPILRV